MFLQGISTTLELGVNLVFKYLDCRLFWLGWVEIIEHNSILFLELYRWFNGLWDLVEKNNSLFF